VVKVIGGGAEFDVDRGGKIPLRIRFTVEVDGVRRDYEITYGRYEKNVDRALPTLASTRLGAGVQMQRGSPP
jgi:hypothetical protein